jgi:hypothetical protein
MGRRRTALGQRRASKCGPAWSSTCSGFGPRNFPLAGQAVYRDSLDFVYRELSSKRVMTAEWVEGVRLWDKDAITRPWRGVSVRGISLWPVKRCTVTAWTSLAPAAAPGPRDGVFVGEAATTAVDWDCLSRT